MGPKEIAAFIEYCGRPLMEDARIILEKLEGLKLPLDKPTIMKAVGGVVLLNLVGQIIRAVTYITIAWFVCQTVKSVL